MNLELPILQRVLRKLNEEETKEVQRVVNKWVTPDALTDVLNVDSRLWNLKQLNNDKILYQQYVFY